MPELTGNPNDHDVSEFSESITGSCLCGSITVTVDDSELFSKPRGHLCHCANCRKVAGSYVSANLMLDNDQVKITDRDGTLKTYEDKATLSGNPVLRSFCSTDGNPIKSVVSAYPDKTILKMGMFPRIPHPEVEAFGLHKHDWQAQHDGVDTYEIKWAGPDKKLMSK